MMKFHVPIEVEPYQVADLITTALEGGSNHWYLLRSFKDLKTAWNKDLHYSDALRENLEKGYDFYAPVFDAEEDNEKLGELTIATIKEGLGLFAKQYTEKFVEWATSDNYDAGVADIAFQLMVMKEVVYG